MEKTVFCVCDWTKIRDIGRKQEAIKNLKKRQKNLKKVEKNVWHFIKGMVLCTGCRDESEPILDKRKSASKKFKNFKKTFEKQLTSKFRYGIMDKLFTREHRTRFGWTQIKNWIEGNELNILKEMFESFCQLTLSTKYSKNSQQKTLEQLLARAALSN